MHYEAVIHQKLPFQNAEEAAMSYRTNCQTWQTPCWTKDEKTFYLVADGHIDEPKVECAVIMEVNNEFFKIESITSAWIDSNERFVKMIQDCTTVINNYGKTQLLFKATGKEFAMFTCGCCGNTFSGNVKEQLKHDQDAGYGICPSCELFY